MKSFKTFKETHLDLLDQKYGKLVFKGILALVAVAAGVFSYVRYNQNQLMERHRNIYGNLMHPAFIIVHDDQRSFPLIEDEFKEKYKEFEQIKTWEADLSRIEQELALIKKEIGPAKEEHEKSNAGDIQELIDRFLRGEQDRFEELISLMHNNLIYLNFTKDYPQFVVVDSFGKGIEAIDGIISRANARRSFKVDEPLYGDLIGFGNTIFEKVTGKPVPPSLEVVITDIEGKDAIGRYIFEEEKIELEDTGYAGTLVCYLHELGHLCYQGGEEARRNALFKGSSMSREKSILEETAAYLFMINGAEEVIYLQPGLGKDVKSTVAVKRKSWMDAFAERERDEHPDGFVLAESLAQHFNGDYGKAFNFLSTKGRFSDLPESVNMAFHQFRNGIVHDGKKIPEQKQGIFNRAEALLVEYQNLQQQYNQAYDQTPEAELIPLE